MSACVDIFDEKPLSNNSRVRQTTSIYSGDAVLSHSQQHYGQHRQVEEDDRGASNFSETGGKVIPAPNPGSPTEEDCPEHFTARLGNQPESKAVKKPALRHE